MAENISIDRTSFPADGGTFTINITKDSPGTWGVVYVPQASWYSVTEKTDVTPFLYTIEVFVDRNDTGSTREMNISVTIDGLSELFTITQESEGLVAAEIVAYSPQGNISASGGSLTIDIYASNGIDSQTTAASDSAFCILASTQHGISSGGYTCTRFVFTFAENTGTASRSATITFTATDGSNTATATLSKAQAAPAVQSGSLAVANASATASATSASAVVTATDMRTSTLAVTTTAFTFVTSAYIQASGNTIVLALTFPANTATAARTENITISGTDNYGNTLTATMVLTQAGTNVTNTISAAWRSAQGYDGILDYAGGREEALVTFTGSWSGDMALSYPALPSGVTISTPAATIIRAEYTGGNIEGTQIIPITISRTGSDSVVYSATLSLTLQASGVFPIWADTLGHITSAEDFEDYELQENGRPFYTGRAFAYPDEDNISVNLSRVVAPYLTGYFKDVEFFAAGAFLGRFTFVRDYSYNPEMDYSADQWLNRPINGRIPSGVQLSASKWAAAAGGTMRVTDESGSVVVNETMAKGLNVGRWTSGNIGKVYTLGDESYKVVNACQGALLRYVNAYGAEDFFLVEGVAKKKDTITRATYEKDAVALSADFESTDYQNTMAAEWTGTTGWLTDAQSLRMRQLVESVSVYMLDLSTGQEIPVLMRDKALDYKTFYTNGRKLINYTLTWTESQTKIRR